MSPMATAAPTDEIHDTMWSKLGCTGRSVAMVCAGTSSAVLANENWLAMRARSSPDSMGCSESSRSTGMTARTAIRRLCALRNEPTVVIARLFLLLGLTGTTDRRPHERTGHGRL